MTPRTQRLGLLLLAASCGAVRAHDCWIEPVEARPAPGAQVGIRLLVGDRGELEAYPRRPERVLRFEAVGPGGALPVEGRDGDEPAGAVALGPGTWALAYCSRPSSITLPAERFEAYLREEGLDAALAWRAARGLSDAPGRERYARCAKALVATGFADAPGWDRALGLELELVPLVNPLLLRPGDELPVRLLQRGRPVPRARVHAFSRERWDLLAAGTTDAGGVTRLRLPAGGRWVLAAVSMRALQGDPEHDWESVWASLSFEARSPGPAFAVEVAAIGSGAGLGGCAAGDLLPERPGHEVAAVSSDGGVHLAWPEARGWRQTRLHQAPGELIQVAAGDLVPGRPGDELVAVGVAEGGEDSGAPGVALVLSRRGGVWTSEQAGRDGALLHAAVVGRGEAFLGGYGKKVFRLRDDRGVWALEELAGLPGPARSAALARGSVVFACKDGTLGILRPAPDVGWQVEELDRHRAGRARVGAAGDRLISCDDDGALTLLEPGAAPQELYRSPAKLRGAVLADLDPASPGLEAATAGYAGEVVLLRRGPDGAWTPEVLAREPGGFHHLCLALLAGDRRPSLVAAARSGRLVVVRPRP